MTELKKNQFSALRSLLPGGVGYLEPRAVLEGHNRGWVFADNPEGPRAALVWSQGVEGCYLLGERPSACGEEINRLINTTLRKRLAEQGADYLEISAVPPAGGMAASADEELKAVFSARKLHSWTQCVYKRPGTAPVLAGRTPAGMRTLNALRERPVKNQADVEAKILRYWYCLEDFYQKGEGCCVVRDGMAVSWAITGWMADGTREVSIDTLEPYRRRGYAEACAAAVVNGWVAKGLLPYWEHDADNSGSARLAQKLGFVKLYDYTCYGFSLAPQ